MSKGNQQPQPSQQPTRQPESELKLRVEKLEKQVRALLLSQTVQLVDGRPLLRCTCGKFACRAFEWNHPVVGIGTENVCDQCTPYNPIARRDESKLSEKPYFIPEHATVAIELNRAIREGAFSS